MAAPAKLMNDSTACLKTAIQKLGVTISVGSQNLTQLGARWQHIIDVTKFTPSGGCAISHNNPYLIVILGALPYHFGI